MPRSDPDIAALADALRPVLLRLSRRLRRESHSLGVSPLDAMLLGHIKNAEGIGVSDLADQEHISRPSMSTHVKRLEAAGWIARLPPQADDKRRIGLALTPEGRRALEAVRRRRTDWLASQLSTLPPEARTTIERALEALSSIAGDAP